jgi:hypothetical protein
MRKESSQHSSSCDPSDILLPEAHQIYLMDLGVASHVNHLLSPTVLTPIKRKRERETLKPEVVIKDRVFSI